MICVLNHVQTILRPGASGLVKSTVEVYYITRHHNNDKFYDWNGGGSFTLPQFQNHVDLTMQSIYYYYFFAILQQIGVLDDPSCSWAGALRSTVWWPPWSG